MIADLVLHPAMDAADLAREKQVVAQEIAEAADAPDDLVFELAQDAAFAGQPLGRPILGTPASIGTATPQTLGDWRARPLRAWEPGGERRRRGRRGRTPDAGRARLRPGRRGGIERNAAARRLPGRVEGGRQAAGAGQPRPAAAGRGGARPGLLRPAAAGRDPGRRHGLAALPGSPREPRPGLRHRRLFRDLCRRRRAGGLRRLRGQGRRGAGAGRGGARSPA